MLQAVIFDVYGTLLCTGTGSVDAAAEILQKCGRTDIEPKAFYARWKELHRQHMDKPGPFRNEEAIYHLDLHRLYQEYGIAGDADGDVEIMLATLGTRTPYPETKDVLEALQDRVPLCIGSITDDEPLRRDLARNGLEIGKIYTSEGLRCYKPAPAFYKSILRELGIQPQEALFVGDSLLNDVAGPQAVGIPGCWVNRKGAAPQGVLPAYTVADLRGLVPIIGSLLEGARL